MSLNSQWIQKYQPSKLNDRKKTSVLVVKRPYWDSLWKKRTDTLVGPIETEKIDTAVLSAIILPFHVMQRGGLTDKAVVCDARGPWFKSSKCREVFFTSFSSFKIFINRKPSIIGTKSIKWLKSILAKAGLEHGTFRSVHFCPLWTLLV